MAKWRWCVGGTMKSIIFGLEKRLKEVRFMCWIWCISKLLLRIWTKIAHSNLLKVDQNCILTHDHKFRIEIESFSLRKCRFSPDHVSSCNFDPLSNCLSVQFWSRFDLKLWTKIASTKQILHVIINSLKHFVGPHIGPGPLDPSYFILNPLALRCT